MPWVKEIRYQREDERPVDDEQGRRLDTDTGSEGVESERGEGMEGWKDIQPRKILWVLNETLNRHNL